MLSSVETTTGEHFFAWTVFSQHELRLIFTNANIFLDVSVDASSKPDSVSDTDQWINRILQAIRDESCAELQVYISPAADIEEYEISIMVGIVWLQLNIS